MTITETKTMVNAILDLNETDNKFTFAPGVSMYQDGSIIVSCMIHSKSTGEAKNVKDFKGDIFRRIDEARNAMIVNRKKFIKQRRAELEKELEKLNG